MYAGNRTDAQRYIDRARRAMIPDESQRRDGFRGRHWLDLLPAHDFWAQGDVAEAIDFVARATRSFEAQTVSEDAWFVCTVGTLYLTFGRLDDAEQWLQPLPDVDPFPWCAGWLELARRDWPALRELDVLGARLDRPLAREAVFRTNAAWLLPRAGAVEAARFVVHDFAGPEAQRRVAEGYVALAEGRAADAVSLLQQGFDNLTPARALRRLEALADAWVARGALNQAVRVLETVPISKEQSYCYCGSVGMFWMRTRWRLAELYREVGRVDEARAVESELRNLLQYADADHPMLLDLQRLEAVEARSTDAN